MKLKPLVRSLRKGKLVKVVTENGEWLMFYENVFPYIWVDGGNIRLLHRHDRADKFHDQIESEWCTTIGLRNLLNYIQKHDFEYLNANDRSVVITEVDLDEVVRDLPYDKFLEDVRNFYAEAMLDEDGEKELRTFIEKTFVNNPYVTGDVRKDAQILALSLESDSDSGADE